MPVERARPEGLQLTGQGGLLQQLTKRVLELSGAPTTGSTPSRQLLLPHNHGRRCGLLTLARA
jgi:hypothetical protein